MSVGTTIVTAAITAGVVSTVGWLAQTYLPRLRVWFARRSRDHSPIGGGWYKTDDGRGYHFHAVVRCAPSRTPPRMSVPDVGEACRFVGAIFPEVPPIPRTVQVTDLKFALESDDPREEPPTLYLYDSGLIEARLILTADGSVPAAPSLDMMDVLEPLARMLEAVRAGWYKKLYPHFRGRIDWQFMISPSTSLPDGQWNPWRELQFPGRQPAGRASEMVAPNPRPSFGEAALTSKKLQSDPLSILSAVTADLLQRAGYWGFDDAVADLVEAVTDRSVGRGPLPE
jgi:hypothetical protein